MERTADADLRQHPWGYSWSVLRGEQCGKLGQVVAVHDTVVVLKDGGGVLACMRCRRGSADPCQHVYDVIASRQP
jgi:hypothetical protein